MDRRWSNNRFDSNRRDIWLLLEDDATWTVEIRVGALDQPQRRASWTYALEVEALAQVKKCIATGGLGWTEIAPNSGPGGVGWYLGQSA